MLTASRLRDIIHYDLATGVFAWRIARRGVNVLTPVGCIRSDKQIIIGIDGRDYRAHRLAWLYVTGEWPPKGVDIDHIGGDRTNNVWSNLRLATRSQNNANRKVSNSATGAGVYQYPPSGKWRARIKHNGKTIHLGSFDTKDDAQAARRIAQERAFGEYCHHLRPSGANR